MSQPLYADVSSFQGVIDWQKYAAWAKEFDGTARVAMKAAEGVGFTDPRFQANRAGALAAGVDSVLYYHYARPDIGNSAVDEANWLFHVVSNVREQDAYMLDYEQNTGAATAQWAYDFLSRIEELTGRTPTIYASTSFVRTHLQDQRLSRFPLILANWTYDPSARPACPAPWTSYLALQFSDKASIPGIAGACDANVWLGPAPTTGGTVSELLNFPFVNQRTDGDLNHDYDCVPSSLEAGANYLLGKPVINDAAMKDAIYGAGYVGGTAASAYVDYLKARGVHIYPIDGAYPDLLKQAHQHLAAGHPVVFTRDDPYSSNPADSHVCVWYKDTATSLTCMDPFGAHAITMTDTVWEQHLRFNEIWIMEKIMPIPTNWTDDGHTLMAPNKVPVILGFRQHILDATSWDSGNQPQEAEYATNQVLLHNAGVGGGTRQVFRDSLLWYTSTKGVVEEPFLGLEIDAAYKLIDSLKAQLAQTQQPAPAPVDTTALLAAINAIPDAIAQATATATAQAVMEAKKL